MYDLILCACIRSDASETVENVDMSFEELQLLLRNHQQSMESSSSSVDVGTTYNNKNTFQIIIVNKFKFTINGGLNFQAINTAQSLQVSLQFILREQNFKTLIIGNINEKCQLAS